MTESAVEGRARVLVEFGCVSQSKEEDRDGYWRVKSQTTAGTVYEVTEPEVSETGGWLCEVVEREGQKLVHRDLCPAFGRGMWCKHIVAVKLFKAGKVKVRFGDRPVPPPRYTKGGAKRDSDSSRLSMFKSALQKNIRRLKKMEAVRVANAMIELGDEGIVQLTRRFPIILIEDVIMPPYFDKLIEIMIRASSKGDDRKSRFTEDDKRFLLQAIYVCCAVDERDLWPVLNESRDEAADKSISPEELRFSEDENDQRVYGLLASISTRIKYGAMSGDKAMMRACAYKWSQRFREDRDLWLEKLDSLFSFDRCPDIFSGDLSLRKDDVPLIAVDPHCSPMHSVIAKNTRYGKSEISTAVCWLRSFVNPRICWDLDRAWEPGDTLGEGKLEFSKRMWPDIAQKVEDVSVWWLRKIGLR